MNKKRELLEKIAVVRKNDSLLKQLLDYLRSLNHTGKDNGST